MEISTFDMHKEVPPISRSWVLHNQGVHALVPAVQALVADSELRRSCGQRSLEVIRILGLKECGDGIVKAFEATV